MTACGDDREVHNVKGEQERCQHSSLWDPCAADQPIGDAAPCPHILWAARGFAEGVTRLGEVRVSE